MLASSHFSPGQRLWWVLENAPTVANVRQVLEEGASANAPHPSYPGSSPLEHCARNNLLDTASVLIEAGAEKWPSADAEGACFIACIHNNHAEMFDLLARGFRFRPHQQALLLQKALSPGTARTDPKWIERLLPLAKPSPWGWLAFAGAMLPLSMRPNNDGDREVRAQASSASLELLDSAGVFSFLDHSKPMCSSEARLWRGATRNFDRTALITHPALQPFILRHFPFQRLVDNEVPASSEFRAWKSELDHQQLQAQVVSVPTLSAAPRL